MESGTIKKAEHQRLMLSNCGAGEELLRISWTPKSLQIVTAAMKLKDAYSLEAKESIPSNCGSGEEA